MNLVKENKEEGETVSDMHCKDIEQYCMHGMKFSSVYPSKTEKDSYTVDKLLPLPVATY